MSSSHLLNKEISWLSFNARVLQEAADPSVPLAERIRFLGIFSNNLDEFFRIRVATLTRLAKLGEKAESLIGHDPRKVLKTIRRIVLSQSRTFDAIDREILTLLESENILIADKTRLTPDQRKDGGSPRCYLTSADFMPRNLDRRIEVACPVYDPRIVRELKEILDLQWRDNTKARILDRGQRNDPAGKKSDPPVRSQSAVYGCLKNRTGISSRMSSGRSPA